MTPQEALSSQFYTGGEEAEHGKQNGHLEQQGQTARHRVGACLVVQCHCFLLAYHSVFLSRIFVVDSFYIRSKYTHLGLALVALIGEGEEHDLYEDCEQQYDYTVVPVE